MIGVYVSRIYYGNTFNLFPRRKHRNTVLRTRPFVSTLTESGRTDQWEHVPSRLCQHESPRPMSLFPDTNIILTKNYITPQSINIWQISVPFLLSLYVFIVQEVLTLYIFYKYTFSIKRFVLTNTIFFYITQYKKFNFRNIY